METLIESPRVAFVSGSSLPASSPFSLYRLILPLLCITLGVSVGTAAGLTLALVNAANSSNSVVASSNPLQASAAPSANLEANASSTQTTQPVVAPSTIASPTTLADNSATKPTVEEHPVKLAPAKVEVAFNKTPDALKPATLNLEGKTYHVARMTFLPSAKPDPQEPAVAQSAPPTALNTTQWSLDTPAPATLYTEGVLTVSDYSASTGTIQTSDGRTFALGTTVAAGNAISWESYRSDVHYRCDQNGSCVLMRAGVVAPDAKLI